MAYESLSRSVVGLYELLEFCVLAGLLFVPECYHHERRLRGTAGNRPPKFDVGDVPCLRPSNIWGTLYMYIHVQYTRTLYQPASALEEGPPVVRVVRSVV